MKCWVRKAVMHSLVVVVVVVVVVVLLLLLLLWFIRSEFSEWLLRQHLSAFTANLVGDR